MNAADRLRVPNHWSHGNLPSTIAAINKINRTRELVMPRRSMGISVSCLVFIAWLAGTDNVAAQAASALARKVTAGQEAREGVLVSPTKTGAPAIVTLASHTCGAHSSPA